MGGQKSKKEKGNERSLERNKICRRPLEKAELAAFWHKIPASILYIQRGVMMEWGGYVE